MGFNLVTILAGQGHISKVRALAHCITSIFLCQSYIDEVPHKSRFTTSFHIQSVKILDICECLTHFETWWRSGWGLTESNCPILLVPFDLQEHKIHNMLCLLWIIYLCFDQIPRILNTKHITNITHKCGGNNMRKGNYQCFSIGDFSPWKGCHGGGNILMVIYGVPGNLSLHGTFPNPL